MTLPSQQKAARDELLGESYVRITEQFQDANTIWLDEKLASTWHAAAQAERARVRALLDYVESDPTTEGTDV